MFTASVIASLSSSTNCTAAQPPVWPTTFTLVQRRIPDDPTAGNATTVTYYDFEHGANLIQITSDDDPAAVLWDLELNSHHSYYFTPSERSWPGESSASRCISIATGGPALTAPAVTMGGPPPKVPAIASA